MRNNLKEAKYVGTSLGTLLFVFLVFFVFLFMSFYLCLVIFFFFCWLAYRSELIFQWGGFARYKTALDQALRAYHIEIFSLILLAPSLTLSLSPLTFLFFFLFFTIIFLMTQDIILSLTWTLSWDIKVSGIYPFPFLPSSSPPSLPPPFSSFPPSSFFFLFLFILFHFISFHFILFYLFICLIN